MDRPLSQWHAHIYIIRTDEGCRSLSIIHESISLISDLDCDNITSDISELVGANDAAAIALRNAATIADLDFDRDTFLNAVRTTKVYLAGVSCRQRCPWVFSSVRVKKGVRIFLFLILNNLCMNEIQPNSRVMYTSTINLGVSFVAFSIRPLWQQLLSIIYVIGGSNLQTLQELHWTILTQRRGKVGVGRLLLESH
jgi:hypothetical protein